MTEKIFKHFIMTLLGMIFLVPGLKAQDQIRIGQAATKVSFESGSRIFPCKWKNKRISPQAWPVKAEEIPRLELLVAKALEKYPPKVLRRNLKMVYVVRQLTFFGLEYGGTYFRKTVYITDNGLEHGYTDQYIEGTIHHELSSVLLKRNRGKFDEKAWLLANPQGFNYGNGGVEALRQENTGLTLDPELFGSGFLNQYSMASIEEDLNCYAEFLFLGDGGFWQAWEESGAVRRKTALLIGFYQALDPLLTMEYFRLLQSGH